MVTEIGTMGAYLGYHLQRRRYIGRGDQWMMLMLLVLFPALMGAEFASKPQPPLCAVHSQVYVDAPPEEVWKNVICFPQLAPPTNPIFALGIAYPTGATISGTGRGAVRKCKFSTGAFIEPIHIWNEPKLLKFGVESQPPSMHETGFLREIHPAHLQGYLQIKGGEFALSPSGRGTLLQGTTWYTNRMWPVNYWRLWSDYIIQQIHMRVLEHVKKITETRELIPHSVSKSAPMRYRSCPQWAFEHADTGNNG
jgi:hypothetical protein